ncbi:MAG: SDR family oxidoreductase [Deltaproteobacteria bacterium]|nr:SDR family oxidoreductase [Deltaproteobacteria bacterium]
MRLKDRVAIVTGGGRGIGLGVAKAMVKEGAHVAICDIGQDILDSGLAEIQAMGGEALALQMDVSAKDQIVHVVDGLTEQHGRIDILVNCAGINEILPIAQITEEQWDRMLAVNLKGVFLCCQAVMEQMKAQGSGSIVSMTSVAGKTGGVAAGAHYSVSKAGIICFTKSLARELGPFNVTVNAVSPGRIDTPMIRQATDEENENFIRNTPLGRLGTPEDVASAVVFLVSDEARFITGEILDVNGGMLMD